MPTSQKKTKEFWETDDWKKFFAPEAPSKGMPGYTLPEFDVARMQQQAIAPIKRAYRKEVPRIESRLSKRGMGRSGPWMRAELEGLEKYLTEAGTVSADYPLKAAALQLEAARHGLTAEQFEKTLAFQREKSQMDVAQWLREQKYRETTTERELGFTERQLDLEAEKLGMTREQFNLRLDWEKDQFGRTLESEDRRFDRRMELEWRRMGLQEQEIADKKEMFYEQLKQYESQFSRELTFKETQSLQDYELRLKDQGLTQQEIDNKMNMFNAELSWQKEHFGFTFNFEKKKWMDEYALAAEQSNLNRDEFNETIRQFDEALKQSGALETRKLDLQEDLMGINYELDQRRITDQEARTRITEKQVEYERDMQWGWTDVDGVRHEGQMDMEKRKNDIMGNQIFGYWDEGFDPNKFPDKFVGEKYQRDTDGDYLYVNEEGVYAKEGEIPHRQGNWRRVHTQEWTNYMTDHYHKGMLDLKEWDLNLDYLFATMGVSNEFTDQSRGEWRRGQPPGSI